MNANRLTKSGFGRARCPQRAEMLFPRITRITADMNWLRKTTVGRRCDQKTLRQRFLAQPDGQHGLRPCAANAAQFSSSLSVSISANKWLKNLNHPWFECMDPSAAFATFVFKIRSLSVSICACHAVARSTNSGRRRVHPRLKKSDPKILVPISAH